MSMGTGIEEPGALAAVHQGDPTAMQVLQLVENLPVVAKPDTKFIYNNTVYAVAGYLPPLLDGVSGPELTAAYAELMRDRVYRPAGMAEALLADDPRGRVANFSRGYGLELTGGRSTLPYAPVGSYWPVGGTLATLDDMAAYVRLHLRDGVSVNGRRVVSAANLTERYKPQVAIPLDHKMQPDLDPDAVASGYGMGLIHERYRDGSSLLWHNGGIDGFSSYIGFLPGHDLGLVVLNSMNPSPTGLLFYIYVVNLLLGELLDLNREVPARVLDAYRQAIDDLDKLRRGTRRVDPRAVEPFLGYYEGGYRLLGRARQRCHPGRLTGVSPARHRRRWPHRLRRSAAWGAGQARPRFRRHAADRAPRPGYRAPHGWPLKSTSAGQIASERPPARD